MIGALLAPFNIPNFVSFLHLLLIYVFLLYFMDLNESPEILLEQQQKNPINIQHKNSKHSSGK